MPLDPSTKNFTPKNDFVCVTELTPPNLTEADRTLIKSVLEGVVTDGTKKIEDVIKGQIPVSGWMFSESERNRIHEIVRTVDWGIWRSQFKIWLREAKWF